MSGMTEPILISPVIGVQARLVSKLWAGLGLASPTVMREASADVVNEDQAKLQQMQESLAKFGVNATTRQLTEGTADAVMAEVQNLNADLVVMGTHKHGWLYNFFVGSVVNDVLKRMTCPVLLVPADEA